MEAGVKAVISGAQQYSQEVLHAIQLQQLKNPIAYTYQIAIVRYVVATIPNLVECSIAFFHYQSTKHILSL